jgi:hypothetical protein
MVLIPVESRAQIGSGGVNVLTWHNDNYRTGGNLSEATLAYNAITKNTFGQLCATAALDGQVYGQPLVVTNVTLSGKQYKYVVYVVTQSDTLYAIDGDPTDNPPCQILKSLPFLSTSGLPTNNQYPRDCRTCTAIAPVIGALGTPVINISNGTGTIYLVTESQNLPSNATTFYDYLFAVDVQTFNAQWIQVCSSGCGIYSSSDVARFHIQRPGLLFANCGSACGNLNYVYVAFSMRDGVSYPYPNGAIFGFNAANLSGGTVFFFQSSNGNNDPSSNGGGIWQGGVGPAFGTADSSGKNWIYFSTGNGTFDLNTNGANAGDSFLKLDPNGLTLTKDTGHYFAPADEFYRADQSCLSNGGGDVDFGSGGPMLIPDNQLTNWPYLAVTGDKEGGLWFVNRTTPNGFSNACGNTCNCQQPSSNVQTYWTGTHYNGNTIHNGLAFWEYDQVYPFLDHMFAGIMGGQIMQYPLCADPHAQSPIDLTTCTAPPVGSVDTLGHVLNFSFGTTPSITANGQAPDAVVWAINKPDRANPEGTQPGVLYAFDAVTMHELYGSDLCSGDSITPATKFSVATVANGYVYVGTQETHGQPLTNTGLGKLYIFGPLSRTC